MTPEVTSVATQAAPVIAQGAVFLILLLAVREMVWKGIALWKA